MEMGRIVLQQLGKKKNKNLQGEILTLFILLLFLFLKKSLNIKVLELVL